MQPCIELFSFILFYKFYVLISVTDLLSQINSLKTIG